MECENCHKEHNGSYGSGRFCSDHCRRVYSGKRVNINGKQKCNFNASKHQAPYGTWKCKFCNQIFDTRYQMELHIQDKHHLKYGQHGKGQKIWNKGLTKETSEIIANAAIKASKSLKGKRHFHSKETREKLSIARSRRIDKDHSGFLHIKWYKVKNLNGDEYTVRGHWEENVALQLNSLGILWTKNRWIKYKDSDGVCHRYNPDFYIPAYDVYVEVKGYYSEKDKQKMKYVVEQNKNIIIYFIGAKQYKPFIDGKIQFDNNLKLVI